MNKALSRTAHQVKMHRIWMRILPMAVGCLVIMMATLYVISIMYNKFGSFTVMADKYDNLSYGLALSETQNFSKQISRLNARASEDITNISVEDLPSDLDNISGSHNGEDYMAYTFYCKNVGEEPVTYEYHLYVANVTNDLDKAIRVRLYVNGDYTDFARTATDGSGPEPETVEFSTATTVCRKQIEHFAPGDVTKYTVVIWIEGDDPDCTDVLLAGQIKMDMKMSVIKSETPDSGK